MNQGFARGKRLLSIALIAFMLGISNVFLQEDRMINDSHKKLEQKKIQDEDDQL